MPNRCLAGPTRGAQRPPRLYNQTADNVLQDNLLDGIPLPSRHALRRDRGRRLRRPKRGAPPPGARREGAARSGAAPARPRPARPVARRRASRKSIGTNFSSSTRNWRRCSKPACRSCSRSTSCASRLANPVFKAVLDDVHEKVRSGTALSDAFQSHGELFPSVYTASLMAGERAGNLDAVLRRYVAYAKVVDTVRKKTISALVYPVILIGLAVVLVGDHRDQGRPDVLGVLRELQRPAAALDAHHRRVVRLRAREPAAHRRGAAGRRRRVLHLDQTAGATRAVRPMR